MNLAQELQKISDKTESRLNREKNKTQVVLSKKQKEEDQKEADQILKDLPGKLRNSAKHTDIRKYEVMQMHEESIPFTRKFNPSKLKGVARRVFAGCKKMKLDVRLEHSEFDNGMTGESCAGIWVHWK